MSKYKNILVAGAALVALSGAAMAGGSHGGAGQTYNINLSAQVNLAEIFSQLNLYADWVGGELRGQSVAIGNNLAWSVEGGAILDNTQHQLADVGAEITVTAGYAGSMDVSSVGICNNASVENMRSSGTSIRNDQRCMTLDPYALTNVSVGGVGGDAVIAATAIANNLSVSGETAATYLYNTQVNASAVNAVVNAELGNVGGNVAATAAAIGNNVVVKTGFGN